MQINTDRILFTEQFVDILQLPNILNEAIQADPDIYNQSLELSDLMHAIKDIQYLKKYANGLEAKYI